MISDAIFSWLSFRYSLGSNPWLKVTVVVHTLLPQRESTLTFTFLLIFPSHFKPACCFIFYRDIQNLDKFLLWSFLYISSSFRGGCKHHTHNKATCIHYISNKTSVHDKKGSLTCCWTFDVIGVGKPLVFACVIAQFEYRNAIWELSPQKAIRGFYCTRNTAHDSNNPRFHHKVFLLLNPLISGSSSPAGMTWFHFSLWGW